MSINKLVALEKGNPLNSKGKKIAETVNGLIDINIFSSSEETKGLSESSIYYGENAAGNSVYLTSYDIDLKGINDDYTKSDAFTENLKVFRQLVVNGLSAVDTSKPIVIAAIGDSWTWKPLRGLRQLTKVLQSKYGSAGAGYVQMAMISSTLWGSADGVVSVSRAGTWVDSNHAGSKLPSISHTSSSVAGGLYSFTGVESGLDRVLLFHSGGGDIRYRWNSGTWNNLTLSGSVVNVENLTIDVAGGNLEVETVSGTPILGGVSFEVDTFGVRVHNLGSTGSTTTHWAASIGDEWLVGYNNLKPCLTKIFLGTNDQKTSGFDVYRQNLEYITESITAYNYDNDLYITAPPENGDGVEGHVSPMYMYAEQAYSLAEDNKFAFANYQPSFGAVFDEYDNGSKRPLMDDDDIHPNVDGGSAIASVDLINITKGI